LRRGKPVEKSDTLVLGELIPTQESKDSMEESRNHHLGDLGHPHGVTGERRG
jgi:hypothetical protein